MLMRDTFQRFKQHNPPPLSSSIPASHSQPRGHSFMGNGSDKEFKFNKFGRD